jgi:hypothetical protein
MPSWGLAMPIVVNVTSKGIDLLRWRILPNSRIAVSPDGRMTEDVPPSVAYSDRAKELAADGYLLIEGYRPASTNRPPPNATVVDDRKPKRARKLSR